MASIVHCPNYLLSSYNYGTAQFKLDRTRVQHGLNTTRFSFYMRASMRVHTRLMTSYLLLKTLVYTLDVCMTVCRCTCACQECTHQIWIMCMQIVSQGQWNKLYEHVHVPRCNSPRDTKHKSRLKVSYCKANTIRVCVFY